MVLEQEVSTLAGYWDSHHSIAQVSLIGVYMSNLVGYDAGSRVRATMDVWMRWSEPKGTGRRNWTVVGEVWWRLGSGPLGCPAPSLKLPLDSPPGKWSSLFRLTFVSWEKNRVFCIIDNGEAGGYPIPRWHMIHTTVGVVWHHANNFITTYGID